MAFAAREKLNNYTSTDKAVIVHLGTLPLYKLVLGPVK